MSDVAALPRPPRIPRPFLAALALLTLTFLGLALPRAGRTTLRGDELLCRLWYREGHRLPDLLARGAQPQISPAPLYYVLGMIGDAARRRLAYLGLTYSGYYRLPSILLTAGLGVAAALLVAVRLRKQQDPPSPIAWFLILCALAVYWFHPKVFAFAGTDRPYALWNGVWLLTLAWMLGRPDSTRGLGVLLILLAATATAACFQILAAGVAVAVVRRQQGRTWKEILRQGARIFTAPAVLGAYYALLSEPAEAQALPDGMTDLARFWLVTNLPAWLGVGAAFALVHARPKLRGLALPVYTLAALVLLIPLIYALASMKGYTNPSRHYFWTTTALPLALFVGALGWHELRTWRPAPALAVLLGLGLVIGFSTATFRRPTARNDSRRLACLEQGSSLSELLKTERPNCLIYLGASDDLSTKNFMLLAEWIRVRFRAVPSGSREVVLRDVDGAIVSDPVTSGPATVTEGIPIFIPK
jgi:hypothetical protein